MALRYAASANSLILELRTSSFMERGANLEYISAFPEEAEILFPPLTFLKPTGQQEVFQMGEHKFTLVVVEPRL